MPSRVRFQTEYNSSFKAPSSEVLKTARSPILRPRPGLESDYVNEKAIGDAGLKSSDAHISREPPLQHRRILKNAHNPNFQKEVEKAQRKTESIVGQNLTDELNPILKYANQVEHARSKDDLDMKKGATTASHSLIADTVAGRESDNLRYLALEPPMQRKRRSPYVFNHNLLRTGTIEYPNGTSVHDNETVNERNGGMVEEQMHSSPENVRKKLHFEQSVPKLDPTEPILPVNSYESKGQTEMLRKNEPLDKKEVTENRSKKKKLSPAKEQRKRDLREMKKKQNERVERGLQIKAKLQNIEPPLFSQPVTTEYRREFSWKEPVKKELRYSIPVSDISKDEEPKSDVNAQGRKYKPIRTEYQMQFKQYPLLKEPELEPRNIVTGSVCRQEDPKTIGSEKRSLHHSKNVQPIFFPHGSQSLSETEYKASFVSPSNAQQKVAWQELKGSSQTVGSDMQKVGATDWFKEVVRLREKAQIYKERARTTHYPTVFLASIEDDDSSSDGDRGQSPQEHARVQESSGLGENTVSNGVVPGNEKQNSGYPRVTIIEKAVGPEKVIEERCNEAEAKAKSTSGAGKENKEPFSKDISTSTTNLVGSNASEVSRKSKNNKGSKSSNKRPKRSGSEAQLENEATQTAFEIEKETRSSTPTSIVSSDTDDSFFNVLKGRVDTARLRADLDHRRHHLDRTTPLRGGIMNAPSGKLSSEVSAPVHEFRTTNQDMKWKQQLSAEKAERNLRSNSDNRALLMGEGNAKIVRETRPPAVVMHKTYHRDKYKDEENGDELTDLEENEVNLEPRAQTLKGISRIMAPPRAYVRPSKHEQRVRDTHQMGDESDFLSDTSMSARDSVISDVLERSRRRRDQFW